MKYGIADYVEMLANFLSKHFLLIIFIGLLLEVMFFIVLLPFGFKMADEAYYLQLYNPKQDLGLVFSYFGHVVRYMLGSKSQDIIFLRSLRIGLTIISGIFLSYSISKYFLNSHQQRFFVLLIPFTIIGFFCSYTYAAPTLSYNSLGYFYMSMYLSLFLLCLKASARYRVYFFSGISIFLSLILLNKISTGVALMALNLIVLVSIYRTEILKTTVIFHSIFALVFVSINYLLNINSVLNFSNIFRILNTSKIDVYYSYNNLSLLYSISDLLLDLLKILAIISFYFGIKYFLIRRVQKLLKVDSNILKIVLVIALFGLSYYTLDRSSSFTILLFFFLVLITLFDQKDKLSVSKDHSLLLLFIFLVPFLGAFGSNTGILRNTILYIGIWSALFFLLMFKMNIRGYVLKNVYLLSILLMGIFTFNGVALHPFRKENLRTANHYISFPNGNKVLTNAKMISFLEETKRVLEVEGFTKQNNLFTMNQYMGVLQYMNAVSPYDLCFSILSLNNYLFTVKRSEVDFSKTFFLLNKQQLEVVDRRWKELLGIDLNATHEVRYFDNISLYLLVPQF